MNDVVIMLLLLALVAVLAEFVLGVMALRRAKPRDIPKVLGTCTSMSASVLEWIGVRRRGRRK